MFDSDASFEELIEMFMGCFLSILSTVSVVPTASHSDVLLLYNSPMTMCQ